MIVKIETPDMGTYEFYCRRDGGHVYSIDQDGPHRNCDMISEGGKFWGNIISTYGLWDESTPISERMEIFREFCLKWVVDRRRNLFT